MEESKFYAENDVVKERPPLSKVWEGATSLRTLSRIEGFLRFLLEGLKSILSQPLVSFLTIVSCGVSLFFLGFVILSLKNMDYAFVSTQSDVSVSIFLKDDVTPDDRALIDRAIQNNPGIKASDFISKEDALMELRDAFGSENPVTKGLDLQNPLPASYKVSFEVGAMGTDAIKRLKGSLEGIKGIEAVQYNEALASQLNEIAEAFEVISFLIVIIFMVVTALIISNTITISLFARKEELEILKLIGATDRNVASGFVVEGFYQGLFASVLGILMLYGCFIAISKAGEGSILFQVVLPNFRFLTVGEICIILFCGIGVGVLGSFVATKRFISSYVAL